MTYYEAVRHLNARQMFGIKLGLNNTKKLLKRLGSPERSFKSIHIAGTNGKGSTAAMLASIFAAQGLTTGLYTSPHISTVRERFRVTGINNSVEGELIKPAEFAELYKRIVSHLDEIPCTYFECTTALAFLYFRERKVDIAVIEAGLGGRFDATNVIMPVCSVITTIGYDHQEHLGETLEHITREKCGIIKRGVPVVSGVEQKECRRIIVSTAERKNAQLFEAEKIVEISNGEYSVSGTKFDIRVNGVAIRDLFLSLPGSFQVSNAQTAITAFSVIQNGNITPEIPYIRNGLKSVAWPWRFMMYGNPSLCDRRDPLVIIDVAHNEAGFRALSENIRNLFPDKNVLLVVGMKEGKDWEKAIRPILPLCKAGIGIPLRGVKGISPKKLGSVFKHSEIPFRYFQSVRAGVLYAYELSDKNDMILCAGSHFTVNAVKKVINSLD